MYWYLVLQVEKCRCNRDRQIDIDLNMYGSLVYEKCYFKPMGKRRIIQYVVIYCKN